MYRIPLNPVPNQMLTTLLDGQVCNIEVRQNTTGVYLSLWMNDKAVQTFIKCLDRVPTMNNGYTTFRGYLMFVDTQGKSNPDYTGFGTRYQLYYQP